MADVTTMEPTLWPLMDAPSIRQDHCVICGRRGHLEQHHIVRRGAGQLVRDGKVVPKPTVTLCGLGNTSGCHGLAHQNRLHFRYDAKRDRIQALTFAEPTKYADALEQDGWCDLPFVDSYWD